MSAPKNKQREGILSDRNEWDFSEIEKCPNVHQNWAVWWELMREGARQAELEVPPPWLSLKNKPMVDGCKEIGLLPLVPFRIVADNKISGVKAGESIIGTFAINLAFFSVPEVVAAFSRWLRTHHAIYRGPESRGRKDHHVAELWDLSVYRLCDVAGLSYKQAQEQLHLTSFRTRRSKFFGKLAEIAFADSLGRCRKSVSAQAEEIRANESILRFAKLLLSDSNKKPPI